MKNPLKRTLLLLAAVFLVLAPVVGAGDVPDLAVQPEQHTEAEASLELYEYVFGATSDELFRPKQTSSTSCEDQCNAEYDECEDRCYQTSQNQDELGYCLDDCIDDAIYCYSLC